MLDYAYRPDTLIADAAEAITNGFMSAFDYASIDDFNRLMCYPHVDRNVDQHLKSVSKEIRDEIDTDIDDIQIMYSKESFEHALKLFNIKWRGKETSVDNFLDYFEKVWIRETTNQKTGKKTCHNKWYEGAHKQGQPSNNNGLESNNRVVKDKFTLRERMAISRYLENSFDMVRNWSKDRDGDKAFKTSVKVKDEKWKLADNFLYRGESKGIIKKLTNQDTYVVTRFENLINYDLIYENFEKMGFNSFEEYMECCKHVHVVIFDLNKWAESKCTCSYYMKKYHCYHIFVVAVNEKLLFIMVNIFSLV